MAGGDSLRVRYPKEKYTAQIADEQKNHGPELALKSCYLYRTLYPTVRKIRKGLLSHNDMMFLQSRVCFGLGKENG